MQRARKSTVTLKLATVLKTMIVHMSFFIAEAQMQYVLYNERGRQEESY